MQTVYHVHYHLSVEGRTKIEFTDVAETLGEDNALVLCLITNHFNCTPIINRKLGLKNTTQCY